MPVIFYPQNEGKLNVDQFCQIFLSSMNSNDNSSNDWNNN